MFGTVALSTEMVEQIINEDINAHFAHMDKLIGNAERHGEPSVARELTRTMEEYALSINV